MNIINNTQIIGVSPEDFKKSIIEDVKVELKKITLNSNAQIQEEYLTRSELSKLLKVTLPTISDWSKKGIIKPYRLGKLVRFKKSEIESTLKQI